MEKVHENFNVFAYLDFLRTQNEFNNILLKEAIDAQEFNDCIMLKQDISTLNWLIGDLTSMAVDGRHL